MAPQFRRTDGAQGEVKGEGKLHCKLGDLLTGIKPRDMQDVFDWGRDMGREIIDQRIGADAGDLVWMDFDARVGRG